MAYIEITPAPGLYLDETPRVAGDYWVDTQLVRWLRGRLQPVGGWAKLLSSTFTGIARGITQWTDLSGTARFALGTHSKFYGGTSSTLYDITPVASYGVLGTDPFAVTSSSTTVTVTHTAHGRAVGDYVTFLNANTVAGVVIQGKYAVVSITSNTYTITHTASANATTSGGGSSVIYIYDLATGNQDGSSSADPRIVTVDNWGEYALFNPRNGGLYEWQLGDPITSSDIENTAAYIQLVTNGNFDVDANWTKGSGWSITAGAAVAASSSASLTQTITVTTGQSHELQFQVPVFVGGTNIQARYDNSTLGSNITTTGWYQRYFTPSSQGDLEFRCNGSVTANVDNVRLRRLPRVKNGRFIDTFATGVWTAGTGWSHDAVNYEADAAAGSASSLTQPVSTNITAGAQYVLVFTITRSAGTLQPKYNSVSLGSALSASGTYAITFTPTATGNLEFAKDSSFVGTLNDVQIWEYGEMASVISGAPAQITTFMVTPEAFVLALGCTDTVGTFDPLLVRCCSQGDNTDWTPSATNSAKQFARLSNGSEIMRGVLGRLENLIFTDTALFSCRFVADPTVVFSFDMIAENCGLIAPNAVAVLDGIVYWLSTNGRFYRYNGGQPEALECPLNKDMWDNITANQKFKIAARAVSQFGEIWWHYPRTGNTENSHYVKFNARENNGAGAWDRGTLIRTVGDDASVFGYPLACDASGYVQQHENGSNADGSALSWYATTGFRDIKTGNNQMDIFSIVPDFDDQSPTVDISILTRDYPNSSTTTDGPYSSTTSSTKIDVRSAGREMALKFAGNSTTSFARIGAIRVEVQANGERL